MYCTYRYVLTKIVTLDIRHSATCCGMNTLQFVRATCTCLEQGPRILQSYWNTNSAVFRRLLRGPTSRSFVYGFRLAMALPWRKARNLSARVPTQFSPCWICGWRIGCHCSRLLSENFGFFVCILPPIFVFTATLDCWTNGESWDTATITVLFQEFSSIDGWSTLFFWPLRVQLTS